MNALDVAATAAALALLGSALPSQGVTSRIFAATPITAQCLAGSQSQQATQPAGPLPTSGALTASIGPVPVGSALAQVSWNCFDTLTESTVLVGNPMYVDPTVGGVAVAGPNELVVEFSSATPVPVVLEASRTSILSVGVPWPLVALDVGNDGTIEIPNLWATAPVTLAVSSVGPAPLQVRVLFASYLPSAGSSWTTVSIRARPDNGVWVQRNVLGCGPLFMLEPAPVFADRGVAVGGDPGFVLIGLSTQPLLLGPAPFPASIPWACLLMPAPDIVLFAPNGLHVPLPASLRPVQFHVQTVYVSPAFSLWTSDGYTVIAQ